MKQPVMNKRSVDEIFKQFSARGNGAYGLSDVSQLEHGLQAAALATDMGLSEQQIVAALLHDIGHMFVEEDVDLASQGIDDKHEEGSADVLQPVFGEVVSEPVRLHVPAKRYLCTVEEDYFAKLAPDSVTSLELQGGRMSAEELDQFESNPWYKEGVALRRIDEQAKVADKKVPDLQSYYDMALRCVV